MATNTTDMLAQRTLAEEIFRLQRLDGESSVKNGKENGAAAESDQGLALAPLVDKIAYGIAKGLVVAMKELENHIAAETRKVGDSVSRRLDTLQASLQELTDAASEQRSFNVSIQEKYQELVAGAESLKEADVRQEAGLASLRSETKELSSAVSERIDAVTASLKEADTQQQAGLASLRSETKEYSSSVSERIDAVTASLKEADAQQHAELASLRTETRELSTSVSEQIAVATAPLKEADARQEAELGSLRTTTKEFSAAATERIDELCKELSVHQEDIAAVKSTLCGFSTTVEGLAERLDRQADAIRTMCAAYAQRETELESLVDGLARLKAYPAPRPIDRL